MPRANRHLKEATFNFRVDPVLKATFSQATASEHKSAAQVLRDFMRAYVDRLDRESFALEALRQSREAAARARNPQTDEAQSLREMETEFDQDHFSGDWKR